MKMRSSITDMHGSSDSDGTIVSVGSSESRTDIVAIERRRFLPSSPSPNAFLTPAFTAAASEGGSISNSPLNIDPSLLRFTQSRLSRLQFSSSSSSSNESPDSSSPSVAAVAGRMRLQQLINLQSLSSSSRRSSTQTPLSPIDNLQSLPLSSRSYPSYPIYKTPMNVEMEEDVVVMDALSVSLPLPGRNRQPLEFTPSSSSSSVNNNPIGANFFYKTDICRAWEECGFCRFGSRCQFAHGKEELRGSSRHHKLKPESGKRDSAVGSSIYGDKYVLSEALDSSASDSPIVIYKPGGKKMKLICPDRQPPVMMPQEPSFAWPPPEDVEDKIHRVLYGPHRRLRRLPVFVEICTGSE